MSEQRLKVEAEILKRIDSIRPSNPKKSDYTHGIDVGLAMAKVAIKDAPTIEERKTGKWIIEPYDVENDIWVHRCGECMKVAMLGIKKSRFNYCPNCGARMVQEGAEKE